MTTSSAVAESSAARPGKGKNIALWVLQIVVALAFLAAGFAKLSGQPVMVDTFTKIGMGQWFRYLTGGVEVVAAILLVVPRLAAIGATVLVVTMVGAVIAHLTVLGGSPVPPLVLGVLAAVIAAGRRS